MLKYGFFDSIEGDRTYGAEDLSNIYEGLLTNGVIRGVASEFRVIPGTGMNITVGTGKAVYDGKWMKNTSPLEVTLAKTGSYDRIDLVVARVDHAERKMEVDVKMGVPAVSPEAPTLQNTADAKEFILARITIPKNTAAVTASMIQDCRTFASVENMKNNAVQYIREGQIEIATSSDTIGFNFGKSSGAVVVKELKINENSVIHVLVHTENVAVPPRDSGYLAVKVPMPPEVGEIPGNIPIVANIEATEAVGITTWGKSNGITYVALRNSGSTKAYLSRISLSYMILRDAETKAY